MQRGSTAAGIWVTGCGERGDDSDRLLLLCDGRGQFQDSEIVAGCIGAVIDAIFWVDCYAVRAPSHGLEVGVGAQKAGDPRRRDEYVLSEACFAVWVGRVVRRARRIWLSEAGCGSGSCE